MPIHMPEKAGMLYRPSNLDEGCLFMAESCDRCIHDNYPDLPFCEIIANTMGYEVDDSGYPKEWIFDEKGYPKCTKFKKIQGIPKMTYKAFSKQMRDCKKDGTLVEIICNRCQKIVLICIKHKTTCHSKACLKERS